jgi:hypothetical protein
MKVLVEYQNGGELITIYESGTKNRVKVSDSLPVFPETVDLKITDYCNAGCKFCHEGSTMKGVHANHSALMALVNDFHPGMEIAIGGGNPMDYPQLEELLLEMKAKKLIPNITINELHFNKNVAQLKAWQEAGLLYGVGVSCCNLQDDREEAPLKNMVYHHILNITDFSRYPSNRNIHPSHKKILVLGYKDIRRGAEWKKKKSFEQLNENGVSKTIHHINKMLRDGYVVAFDNLAIEQLGLLDRMTPSMKEEFYMGDDGSHSMYIDAVNQRYSTTSRNPTTFPVEKLETMFAKVLNLIKDT